MNTAARARQRMLAVFLPITAVLYAGAEALHPKGTDQVIAATGTTFKGLPIAAGHSAQLYLSGSLTVLALGGLAVSYAAIAMLVRGRGWVIATVAVLLGGVGAFSGALLNVRPGRLRARHLPAHYPADRDGVVPRRPGLRRPGPLLLLPRSGVIIALAANSSTDNDDLLATAISAYQTLQKAGAVHTG